jgi:predicted NUDIX family phosphoesterase
MLIKHPPNIQIQGAFALAIDKYITAKLKEKYKNEQVFVVPHTLLSGLDANKFTKAEHTKDIWNKYDTVGRYIFRYDAEADASLQQIIPYIVVYNPDNKKYMVSVRTSGSGESRLVNQMSIGFGGHINPEDGVKDVVLKALFRELHEELFIEPTSPARFIGYVRNFVTNNVTDKDFVHSVHVGMAFVIETKKAEIRETDKLKGEWMTAKDLEDNYFKFEAWSKLIIDYIITKQGL